MPAELTEEELAELAKGGGEQGMSNEPSLCPECNGATVEFRGHGGDTQYRVCSRYAEPGHLSAEAIRQKVDERQRAIRPSGRFA